VADEQTTGQDCSKCNGRGWVTEVDFKEAASKRMVCPKCGGSGKIGQRQGMYAVPMPGVMWLFNWYEEDKEVAELRLHRRAALDQHGNPQWEILELIAMQTQPEWRRKGIMRGMIDKLRSGPSSTHVRYMVTHWDDSTDDGRAFCQALGMKREGPLLTWENPAWRQ